MVTDRCCPAAIRKSDERAVDRRRVTDACSIGVLRIPFDSVRS